MKQITKETNEIYYEKRLCALIKCYEQINSLIA
jgi:hypothetical protein